MLIQFDLFKCVAEQHQLQLDPDHLRWMENSQVFGCVPFKNMLLRLRDIRCAYLLLSCAHEDYRLSNDRLGAVLEQWRGSTQARINNALNRSVGLPEPVKTTLVLVKQAEMAYWATRSKHHNTKENFLAFLEYLHVSFEYVSEKQSRSNSIAFFVSSSLYSDMVNDLNRAIYS